MGYILEDPLGAMDDRDEWLESVRRKSVLAARHDDYELYENLHSNRLMSHLC